MYQTPGLPGVFLLRQRGRRQSGRGPSVDRAWPVPIGPEAEQVVDSNKERPIKIALLFDSRRLYYSYSR